MFRDRDELCGEEEGWVVWRKKVREVGLESKRGG